MQRLHITSRKDAKQASRIHKMKKTKKPRCPHRKGWKHVEPGVRECVECGERIVTITPFRN